MEATWARESLSNRHSIICLKSVIFFHLLFWGVEHIGTHHLNRTSTITCHLSQLVPFHSISVSAANSRNENSSSETLTSKPAHHTCKAIKFVHLTTSLRLSFWVQTLKMLSDMSDLMIFNNFWKRDWWISIHTLKKKRGEDVYASPASRHSNSLFSQTSASKSTLQSSCHVTSEHCGVQTTGPQETCFGCNEMNEWENCLWACVCV